MSSLLANAAQLLHAGQALLGGVAVTYRRGNDSIDSLTAIPVRVSNDELSLDATNITAREQDWIVAVSDLVIDGQTTLPQRGDQIDWPDENGNVRTFRVLPRVGDRAYRYSDQTRVMLRIFTVEQIPNSE
jgi:hypothetical protein